MRRRGLWVGYRLRQVWVKRESTALKSKSELNSRGLQDIKFMSKVFDWDEVGVFIFHC